MISLNMSLKICPAIKLITLFLKNTEMTILQNYHVKSFEDVKLQMVQRFIDQSSVSRGQRVVGVQRPLVSLRCIRNVCVVF